MQGADHEADYRALTPDGDTIWIRDVVHVVRHPDGSPEALVGFMFDISERKKAEDKILQLQKELETLSYQDSLTMVANRRMFDTILEMEWARARVTAQPLSLVLVDIDFFKAYNDRHGHPQGDACLREVAKVLDDAASRTRDLCARLGGEEFALLLPGAGALAAQEVARRCRKLLAQAQLPHGGSPVSDFVTCSMGVATIVPGAHDHARAFIELADRRLYEAKNGGRDRIVGGAA
jgi:diguanylate cyclase (GGDEF)-like protein